MARSFAEKRWALEGLDDYGHEDTTGSEVRSNLGAFTSRKSSESPRGSVDGAFASQRRTTDMVLLALRDGDEESPKG